MIDWNNDNPFERKPCCECKSRWIDVMDGGDYYCSKYKYDLEKCEIFNNNGSSDNMNALDLHKKLSLIEKNIECLETEINHSDINNNVSFHVEELLPVVSCFKEYQKELEDKLRKLK